MSRKLFDAWNAATRRSGERITPQRRAILDYLDRAEHHPTAEEVLDQINRRFPLASRATVYNTLNRLKQAGLIREIHEQGVTRFDPNRERHHHFICRECGRMEDIEWEALPALPPIALAGRRKVEAYAITLRGVCGACRGKRS